MALSAMAVQGAAQTAFMLVGKVLQVLQEVSKAHRDREKEVQSVRILQGKLQDRVTILTGFEAQLPADSLPGTFAVIQSNRLMVHRTLAFISAGLQQILDEEDMTVATGFLAAISCFCQAAGQAAFKWDGLSEQVASWAEQIDQLPQRVEGNHIFLEALQKTSTRPQKCTVPGLSGIYLPVKEVVEQALKALRGPAKNLLITGSPGMGKSLLAADLARHFLPGASAPPAADGKPANDTDAPFPDGVLWVDLRNKFDSEGLLLREKLLDILADLLPPGQEAPASSQEPSEKLEQRLIERFANRHFCLFVDNVHAHDTGTVDSFARITAKHLGKLVVTSCQRQFGPALGGGEAISLTAEAIKKSGVGLKLLLAEAGLVLPESPDHEVALSVEPRILEAAKSIVSSSSGAGYCLSALALIGSRRKHNPTNVHGWKAAQQSIASLAQDGPQAEYFCSTESSALSKDSELLSITSEATSAFLQVVLEASVQGSIKGLKQPALEVLYVSVLFPTGAPVLACVAAEIWVARNPGRAHEYWELLDELIGLNLVQMPKPGMLLISTLHAGFLHQYPAAQSEAGSAAILTDVLANYPQKAIPAVLLLLYGGNIARRAAATCFGLAERSDQMWAYNKATSGTGGLAAVLGSGLPGLREAAARLLGSLVAPWPSTEFKAALEGMATLLVEITDAALAVGASSKDPGRAMGDSLAPILDSLVAVLGQCRKEERLLPAKAVSSTRQLIGHPDATVKVKAVMLLEMVNEAAMTGAKLPKEGAAPATADKAKSPSAALADPLLSSFQIGGEKTFALLREMRTSGDFQQAAAAEKLEASILKSSRLGTRRTGTAGAAKQVDSKNAISVDASVEAQAQASLTPN